MTNPLKFMTPSYWTGLAVGVLVLIGLLLGAYSYGKVIGRSKCELKIEKATTAAVEKQATDSTAATDDQTKTEVRVVTQYRTKIKEVNKYVPVPSQVGAACPADAGFTSLYNDDASASSTDSK